MDPNNTATHTRTQRLLLSHNSNYASILPSLPFESILWYNSTLQMPNCTLQSLMLSTSSSLKVFLVRGRLQDLERQHTAQNKEHADSTTTLLLSSNISVSLNVHSNHVFLDTWLMMKNASSSSTSMTHSSPADLKQWKSYNKKWRNISNASSFPQKTS